MFCLLQRRRGLVADASLVSTWSGGPGRFAGTNPTSGSVPRPLRRVYGRLEWGERPSITLHRVASEQDLPCKHQTDDT